MDLNVRSELKSGLKLSNLPKSFVEVIVEHLL